MLVALALSAGRTVSIDRIGSVAWDEDPPADPRRTIQTYVTRLRAVLGTTAITTEPSGYRLATAPGNVDGLRFAALLDRAQGTDDLTAERAAIDEALALWRGEPFEGVGSDRLDREEATALTERRLTAVERRADIDLALGADTEALAAVEIELVRHPLRESLWLRHFVALHRLGRPAQALQDYERLRKHLANELGTSPSAELQAVHVDLLNGRAPSESRYAVRSPPAPSQLPAVPAPFVGREAELSRLNSVASDGGVLLITGPGGVGKTSLALRWAHDTAESFPDGRLFIDLRGFEPLGSPLGVDAAVRFLLEVLGPSGRPLPSTVEARVALYRTLTADRRLLLLLDNARDAEQVRSLVPTGPDSLTLVTSRNQLTGLAVSHGAEAVPVGLLSDDESRALLRARLGTRRIGDQAVRTMAARCAGLPLALAVIAARSAADPTETADALDALDSGEDATSVRGVFAASHRAVGAAAGRLFALLGNHPDPSVSIEVAASLAGSTVSETRRALTELVSAHLLTPTEDGRYGAHDLLRAYAGELAAEHGDSPAAIVRMLDHYTHTALAASKRIEPTRILPSLDGPDSGVTLTDVDDHERAADWFVREHPTLLAVVGLAAGRHDAYVQPIARALVHYFDHRGHREDWIAVQQAAVAATERLGDVPGQANALRVLGRAYGAAGELERASRSLRTALALYERIGDAVGMATTHNNLGFVHYRLGDSAEAVKQNLAALSLYRRAGRGDGEADVHNNLAWLHANDDDYVQARTHVEHALEIFTAAGDRHSVANALDTLARIELQSGNRTRARDVYHQSLDLYRSLGDAPRPTALTLMRLAELERAAGNTDEAGDAYLEALGIAEQISDVELGMRVREGLRESASE